MIRCPSLAGKTGDRITSIRSLLLPAFVAHALLFRLLEVLAIFEALERLLKIRGCLDVLHHGDPFLPITLSLVVSQLLQEVPLRRHHRSEIFEYEHRSEGGGC